MAPMTAVGAIEWRARWRVAALCLFSGLTAIAGGLVLIARPDGSIIHMPLSNLRYSPFSDFLIPGLLLAGVVGLLNLIAGILVTARREPGKSAAFFAGCAMTVWISVEMVMLRAAHPLQVMYLAIGIATMAESIRLSRRGPLVATVRAGAAGRASRGPARSATR